MGKVLVIAEKYKSAKALKEGLHKNFTYHSAASSNSSGPLGYFESEEIIIVFASGHLFSLFDIKDYIGEKGEKWSMDILPFVPAEFKRKISNNYCNTQFNIIKDLINRSDVDYIVNFGDSDNEGELLIREILEEAKNTKTVKRLSAKEMVPTVVAVAYYNLQDSRKFFPMYQKALARQQTDWLLGINLSRFLSLKAGATYPVGRVLIPIVKYIFDKDIAIKNFSSKKSCGINLCIDYNGFQRTISKSDPEIVFSSEEKSDCDELCTRLNNEHIVVNSISKENKTFKPNKLMHLTDFRVEMIKKFGYSIDEATDAAQYLYENGFTTYPRTTSQYLSENEKTHISMIIDKLNAVYNMNLVFKDNKTLFDDTKVSSEGHTALVITSKFPTREDLDKAPKAAKDGYSIIFNRFVSNFMPQPVVEVTTIKLIAGEHNFTILGDRVLQDGFLVRETRNIKETLPIWAEGEIISGSFVVSERETQPPKKVTPDSLLVYLNNPYSEELKNAKSSDDAGYYALLKSGVSLGTEATINSIIANAIKYGYINEKKQTYSITEKGTNLIKLLDTFGINLYKDRNIEINRMIESVGNQNLTLTDNIKNIKQELNLIIGNSESITVPADYSEVKGFTKCPKCNKPVYKNSKFDFYGCSGYKEGCKFKLYVNDKYFQKIGNTGIKMTQAMAKDLIEKGYTKIHHINSPEKEDYSIKISADFSGDYPKYKYEQIPPPLKKKNQEEEKS